MAGRTIRISAIVLTILVITASVAAADTSGALASIHTNDSDFNNADTLTNVTVTGSGTSSSVEFKPRTEYDTVDDIGDGSTEGYAIFAGDRGNNDVTKSEWRIDPVRNMTVDTIEPYITTVTGSDYGFTIDVYAVQEQPDGTYGEGTLIKSNWDPDFTGGYQTINLDTSFEVDPGETWTLEFITSGTDGDGTRDELGLRMDGSQSGAWHSDSNFGTSSSLGRINISGSADGVTGTYVSQNHTADQIDQAFTDLSLTNTEAEVKWQYWDGSSWVTQDTTSYTASGNKSVSWAPPASSNGKWRTDISFTALDGDSSATLNAEGVEFTNRNPTLNDGTASPSGGTEITASSITLQIDLEDEDFATSQGDEVTVEFFVNGSSIGTDTLTSNGTASTTYNPSIGGDRQWHAEATDDAGNTDTSSNFLVTVPSQLSVRNESDESQLITGDVEATFYATDGVPIAERSTTDGNLSLTGLSVGESFVVVVNVSDYHQRTIYIDDLFEQSDIFLLNQSQSEAQTIFEITDNTGEYPLDTSVIKIQRALDRSEFASDSPQAVRWVTITGEKLGTDGSHTTHLEKFARYRVIVENQDGDQAILGEFVAEFDSTRAFQVGERNFELTEGAEGVEYGASYTTSGGTKYVRFSLNDTEDGTSNVEVVIHERGNESNEIYNATHSGPYGDLSISQPLTAAEEDKEWVVDWSADNANITGEIGSQFVVGQSQRALDIGSNNVETMVSVLLLMLTFFVSSAGINRYVGGVITPFMGATLWYIGWMPAEVGAGVIIFALFLGGAYYTSSSKAGGF